MSLEWQDQYLDFILIDLSFWKLNRIFVLTFEYKCDREAHTRYVPPKIKIKGSNVMIDRKISFDQLIKNDLKHMITFEKLQLVKELITQLVTYWIIPILKNIIG